MDTTLLKTVELRLEAKVDMANRLNEQRFREAIEKFEGYVAARKIEEQKTAKPSPTPTTPPPSETIRASRSVPT